MTDRLPSAEDRAWTSEYVDDFADGLDVERGWHYLSAGPHTADDGVAAATASGVSIAPPGRNPDTGQPMFVKQGSSFADHLKWMVVTDDTFETGATPLRISFRAGATCYGMAAHPYATAVLDVDADIRLGAATLNVMDFETGLVFDFWIGQSVVVPFYERLQLPGTPSSYEAFTAVAEPVTRIPGVVQDFAIVIDAAGGTAMWEVDGTTVASVARLGRSDPTWTKLIDHGGSPTDAVPARVVVGLGLLTLLDGALPPSPEGLADLGSPVVFPRRFATERPTLFGQGVRLDVERVAVERAAVNR